MYIFSRSNIKPGAFYAYEFIINSIKELNINNIDLDIDNEEEDITKLQNKERCFRCYREGHMASFCNAERHIDGFYLKNYINVEEKQKLEEERKKLEEERKYLREERLMLSQERKYLTKDRKERYRK